MNTKAKGSRNERRSRDYLRERGYVVIKAGASLGCFDLLAYNAEQVLFIQVKTNRRPSPEECGAIRAALVPINGYKYAHVWTDGESKPRLLELPGEEAKRRASAEAQRIRYERYERIIRELERGGLDPEAID